MPSTSNLGLPFIEAGQAQKHVTHNEALRLLDTLVQLAVLDRDLNAPPGSPGEGQRWLVKASPSPTGAWTGHGNQIAAWQDGSWQFSAPATGWLAYVVDESALLAWNGDSWESALDVVGDISELQNLALLGVGTAADTANPFAAKLNNALWVAKTVAEGGDGDLRYKLSKESAAKTLSFLLQDNYSGRAELGLIGNDDLQVKVSPDGSTWIFALRVAKDTGLITLPAALALSDANQLVTKSHLDAAILNAGKRSRVRAATTANVNLSNAIENGDTIDGVVLATGDLVLVKDQSTAALNGIYMVPASGAAARAAEFDTYNEHPGSLVAIEEGTTNADTLWICTSNEGGTLGTTAIAFSRIRIDISIPVTVAQGGTGATDAPTARGNLGIAYGAGVRERLTANRTYYVRTDGSDSNTGLADSAGGAFLTIQKAVDLISATLDIAGYTVTVQVRDGTYTGAVTLKNVVGFAAAGNLVIYGNNSTPANVLISTAGTTISADSLSSTWSLYNFKVQSSAGFGLYATNGSKVQFAALVFGACANTQIMSTFGAVVTAIGNYTISAGCDRHWWALQGGAINADFRTITLTGTPAFSIFAVSTTLALIEAGVMTFSGSATGTRYSADSNALIQTFGGGASYFPGNAAGSTATGGQYL